MSTEHQLYYGKVSHVEHREKTKTDGTTVHGCPSSKTNKRNLFVAIVTEIQGFVYDC